VGDPEPATLRAGIHPGDSHGRLSRGACTATRRAAGSTRDRHWCWALVGGRRPCVRERPDQRDRDTTRGWVRHFPPPSSRGPRPTVPAAAGGQGAAHAPSRSWTHATSRRVRRRSGPQPRPTATTGTGTGTARVHLRGATAGRRGRPPPCAGTDRGDRCAAGLACRPRLSRPGRRRPVGMPVGQRPATRTGRRPARPSPAGQRAPARRGGRVAAGACPPLSRMSLAPPAGRAAWRVAGRGRGIQPRFGSRRWGWWERAGRSGRSHGRWGCTRRRCAAGSGMPGAGGGPPWA
jgi:hypothetical protein